MCPLPYDTMRRDSKDPRQLRYRLVLHAAEHGVKPTARAFRSTPPTVRKWVRRWEAHGWDGLVEQSRAPRNPVRRISATQRQEVIRVKKQCPSFGAQRLKDLYALTLSVKAIRRIWREERLLKVKRRKHKTKQNLRAEKAKMPVGRQFCVDTKELDDIPELWAQIQRFDLPLVQYTAREVVSGLQFIAYARERSLCYATLFIERILAHLQACGMPLDGSFIQTDNGSEFIGSWNARADSVFTQAVYRVPGLTHRTIPPGAHTWQADVETVHRLIEDEFYEVETFRSRQDFLAKATTYILWFNVARTNSYKEHQTPWQIIHQRNPDIRPEIVALPPVFLDDLFASMPNYSPGGGHDVIPWPCRPTTPSGSTTTASPKTPSTKS